MEAIAVLLSLVVFCGMLAFPFWVIVKVRRISRLQAEVRRLDERIDTLANDVVGLQGRVDTLPSAAATSTVPPIAVPVMSAPMTIAARPLPAPIVPRPLLEDVASDSGPQPGQAAPYATVAPGPAPAKAAPKSPSSAQEARPAFARQITHLGPAGRDPEPAMHQTASSLDLEQRLGTNWLNKLGATLLVVGIAFFLTFQLRTLGPLGKDIVGLGVGAVLLIGGVVAERRTEYRMFSRGVMAAGWALIFFTTFALHHIPAARVLESQAVDLALMLVVAGGMVAHALRYQSQVSTGLAFLFAFGTVAISHDTAFTLSAGGILAIASAAIAVRMRWFQLEVGAIAATYFNHFLWLPVLASSTPEQAFPRFYISLALLVIYWLTFRVSCVARRDVTADDEQWSALGAVFNTGGVMLVSSQYPLSPGLVFLALLTLGIVDLLFARLVRGRRIAFVTLTTMGVALIVAAFPFRFGPRTVSLAWLIEAEALVMIGVRTRDGLFTRLGVIASALAGVHVYAADVVPLVDARNGAGPHPIDVGVASMLIAACAVYYVNSLRILRSRPDAFPLDFERVLADKLSYAGAAALLCAAWALLPVAWLAPALLAIAFGLALTARRLDSADLWMQGQGAAFLGVVTLAAVNFSDTTMLGPVHRRIAVVLLVAIGHYALYRFSRLPRLQVSPSYGVAHSWIASGLIATLAWYELDPAWRAPALLAIAFGLALVARRLVSADFWMQGQGAAFLSVVTLAAINFNDTTMLGPVHRRIAVVLLAAIGHHALYRFSRLSKLQVSPSYGAVHSWIGSALIATLAWYELEPLAVVLAWSAFAVLALEAGVRLDRRDLRLQAFAALAVAFGRIFVVNLNGSGGLLGSAAVTTAPLALVLFYIYARIADDEAIREREWLPEVMAAFGTVTLGAILRVALEPSLVAMSWSALVLLLAAISATTGRRLFMRQAVFGAIAVCGQAVAVNIYGASHFAEWWMGPWSSVGLSVALMLAALPMARRSRIVGRSSNDEGSDAFADAFELLISRRPDQMLFFAPLGLLVWLAAAHAAGGLITMAWGIEAVAAFMLALWMRERSFRLGALALLLACVLRITMVDVWQLGQQGRYIAFIALGSALLLVSFLYSKYRGLLKELL